MGAKNSSSLSGGTSAQERGKSPGASLERVIAIGALLALIKQGGRADDPDKTWGYLIQALSEARTCNKLFEFRESLVRVLSLCEKTKGLAVSEGFDCLIKALGVKKKMTALDNSFKAIFCLVNFKLGGNSSVNKMIEEFENFDMVMDSIGLQLIINFESKPSLRFGSQTNLPLVEISKKDAFYLNIRDRFAKSLIPFLPCIYIESQEPEQEEEVGNSEYWNERKDFEEEMLSDNDEEELQVKKLVLTKIIQDTAENFTINKLFINENTIPALFSSEFPSRLNIIGFYGNNLDTQCAVAELFEVDKIPKPKKEESLVMYYKPDEKICAIVVANEEPLIFPNGVVQSGDPITVAVRVLIDLCPTIVACLSDEMLDEWYFSKDPNASNPFYKKNHFNREINIKKEIIKDKKIYPVKVNSSFPTTRNHVYLSKDTYGIFYAAGIEKYKSSDHDRQQIRKIIREYTLHLTERIHKQALNTIMHQFSTSLKKYNIVISSQIKDKIEEAVIEYQIQHNELRETVVYKFFHLIQSKFVKGPSTRWETEKNKSINNLLNIDLDQKNFFNEAKKL